MIQTGGFGARQWKRAVALGLMAAILARAQFAGGIAPLAIALTAAAEAEPLVLIGALTGMIGGGTAAWGAVIAFAGALLASDLIPQRFRLSEKQARIARIAGAALGVLLPGVRIAADAPEQIARVLGAAVLAAVGAPFLQSFSRVTWQRRCLTAEEKLGGALLALGLVGGMNCLFPPAAIAAAVAAVNVFAEAGGACAGIALGAAMLLCGGDARTIGLLGILGALAGAFSERPNRLRTALISAVAAPAAALSMAMSWEMGAYAWAGCAMSIAVPERWADRLRSWASAERAACDPDRIARRLRSESVRRLRAMSEAFGEMADGYQVSTDVPDERALIADMRLNLCDGCSKYEECWAGDDNRAVRFLCQLISQAIDWAGGDCSEPLFLDELSPDLLRACARGRTIPARLGILLEDFARLRRSEIKRGAVNQLISAQFKEARLLLEGLADVQSRPMRVRGRQAARARAALDQAGIDVSDVMVIRAARQTEIVATLRAGGWSPERTRRAAERLTRAFGRAYIPGGVPVYAAETAKREGGAEMRFIQQTRLHAETSARRRCRQEGVPSGDSCLARMLEGDRLMLVVSDGMGSGAAAARESAQTVRLLSRFLAADVSLSLALETVNDLMLARTDADMFATVDLCVLDLRTGEAEFSKLAACQSLILRAGKLIRVSGGRLPLGILEGVTPEITRMQLEPGDVLLMASDGVMDAADEEALRRALLSGANADDLAESVLAAAEEAALPARRDDMTALVARITGRERAKSGAA